MYTSEMRVSYFWESFQGIVLAWRRMDQHSDEDNGIKARILTDMTVRCMSRLDLRPVMNLGSVSQSLDDMCMSINNHLFQVRHGRFVQPKQVSVE